MRSRYRRALRTAASAALTYLFLKLEDLGAALFRFAGARRHRVVRPPPAAATPPAFPPNADERTARRIAEAQAGGISSAEGTERWLRGENPGGLHHKAVRAPGDDADLAPMRERPAHEELHTPRCEGAISNC